MTNLGSSAQSETDDKRMLRVDIDFGEANRGERENLDGWVVEKAVDAVKQVISSKLAKDIKVEEPN
uniref:Uncharacterized protein n=1 Tax=Peronospora matthiolae TaxID=2874970 RepID=A0AAV1TRE9_9STRA